MKVKPTEIASYWSEKLAHRFVCTPTHCFTFMDWNVMNDAAYTISYTVEALSNKQLDSSLQAS
jgi:hypothetical protein